MKKYLIILFACLFIASEVFAGGAHGTEAAAVIPDEQPVSLDAVNPPTPLPPLADDETTEDQLDQALNGRGAMKRRMSERRMSRDTYDRPVSGTEQPRY